LGDEPADHPAEAELRSVGFATFSITWKELNSQRNGWIRILPPLDDPAVAAWVVAGKPEDFTDEVRSRVALLTLAMQRERPPATAFVLTRDGEIRDVPYAVGYIRIYRHTQPYAAKLMLARTRPQSFPVLPFLARAHLDPLMGAWLEIAPPDNERWQGFMAGVTQAEVTAFGVGPEGMPPARSTLHFPLLGITGEMGDSPFSACAARNELSGGTSCYMRLDGAPGLVFCADYPDEEPSGQQNARNPVQLEFV
jgi:hypothetical protein